MLIGTTIALVPASALAASGRVTLEVPNASGTQFGFDVETAGATPATAASTDVRTHTSTTVGYRQLVALNGGGVAKLATTDFAAVGCVEMRGAALNGTVFTGSDGSTDPVPGTIYVVRSNLGNYAKMQLVSIKTTAPKGLVLDFETSDCPLDSTPPVITPSVTGAEGFAGWYVGPVTISWTVTDEQSGISSTEGCDTAELSDDSRETTITCTATSAGGTASQSVTVSIDRTAPVVAYDGNRGTYELDEHVVVDCVASDDTSGIASDTCASVDAPAHELGPGTHTASASATDVAGNEGEGSAEFEVIVTPGGVARLIVKLITDTGLASTLRYKA
ncbi:MAG TPA: hypothetical protein VM841_00615, partial [Actinomycetota bacterium]|nr:hypothetical protein [Actinomycetota bacterium]